MCLSALVAKTPAIGGGFAFPEAYFFLLKRSYSFIKTSMIRTELTVQTIAHNQQNMLMNKNPPGPAP